jgi:hypothetical protein
MPHMEFDLQVSNLSPTNATHTHTHEQQVVSRCAQSLKMGPVIEVSSFQKKKKTAE